MLWIKFPIKSNPVFGNGHKSIPRNPPNYPILCNWVFDTFILSDELFAKASWSLETFLLFNSNLWGKVFSSLESPATFVLPQFHILFLVLIC